MAKATSLILTINDDGERLCLVIWLDGSAGRHLCFPPSRVSELRLEMVSGRAFLSADFGGSTTQKASV